MKKSEPSQRQLRVGEEVRRVLAQFLQRGGLTHPTLSNVYLTISEVRMTPDLKIATCFVQTIGGGDVEQVTQTLNKQAGFIRGSLARDLKQMKYMPRFQFRIDESFDNFAHIDAILRSEAVSRDLQHISDKNDKGEK